MKQTKQKAELRGGAISSPGDPVWGLVPAVPVTAFPWDLSTTQPLRFGFILFACISLSCRFCYLQQNESSDAEGLNLDLALIFLSSFFFFNFDRISLTEKLQEWYEEFLHTLHPDFQNINHLTHLHILSKHFLVPFHNLSLCPPLPSQLSL